MRRDRNGHCCTAACTTGGTCGATDCNGTGSCQYPGNSTSCGSASCSNGVVTAAGSCSGTGTCTAGGMSTCGGSFGCNGSACATMCSAAGTAPTGTSVGCATPAVCDTIPATPDCITTLKATSAPCNNRNYECANGTCTGGPGTCN